MDRYAELEREITELRHILSEKEKELSELRINDENASQTKAEEEKPTFKQGIGQLPKWAIERYSRQILLPEIGVSGQLKISSSKVLIVGAGGLGCPSAAYLAGAGVGLIGIVDYDSVDITNIHRQLLHSDIKQDISKVESAANAIRRINSKIVVKTYNLQINSENAEEIIKNYDIVIDCSDNVPTRYLLNDACILFKKPLISGSALKMEGQLTVYNYSSNDHQGPCYRCLFPTPPPPETVGSCSANGVCGPIPGVIGTLQALETLKIILEFSWTKILVQRMLVFDGEDFSMRLLKLRGKNQKCSICSENPKITKLIDYEVFCRSKAVEKDLDLHILPEENRIKATELAQSMNIETDLSLEKDIETNQKQRHLAKNIETNTNTKDTETNLSVVKDIKTDPSRDIETVQKQRHLAKTIETKTNLMDTEANISRDIETDLKQRHLLVDVRNEAEFNMCRIDGAVNFPIELLDRDIEFRELLEKVENFDGKVTFICRRGNDSQIVAKKVLNNLNEKLRNKIKDLEGGLHSWAKHVDNNFPVY